MGLGGGHSPWCSVVNNSRNKAGGEGVKEDGIKAKKEGQGRRGSRGGESQRESGIKDERCIERFRDSTDDDGKGHNTVRDSSTILYRRLCGPARHVDPGGRGPSLGLTGTLVRHGGPQGLAALFHQHPHVDTHQPTRTQTRTRSHHTLLR